MNFNDVTSLPSPSSINSSNSATIFTATTSTIPGTLITTTSSNQTLTTVTALQQPSILIDSSKIMEWTNDDALELIEQYRVHTELWNRADPKYKDKLCRFRAWSEIAERFGCSKAEVERKMNVLLTQYRREKHKMLVKLYEGIQPNPSKWYAFKRFDFMEVGGGSSGRTSTVNNVNNPNSDITNGHHSHSHHQAQAQAHHFNSQHHHHQHHHHLQTSHATLNGLSAFERTTTSVAAAAAAAAGATTPTSSSLHRRMKSKEMKYFGAMGLNLPMLIANQNLDSWNSVGQFSPPIDRNPLRVLPMSGFASQQSEINVPNPAAATRSLFGGSSNSDYTASPQKPMDTSDIEDKDDIKTVHNSTPSSHSHLVQNSIRNGTPLGGTLGLNVSSNSSMGVVVNPGQASNGSMVGVIASSGGNGSLVGAGGSGGGGGGGAGSNSTRNSESVEHDPGSSPIPNTNIHEAHKRDHPIATSASLSNRDQDDLDIKQEMIDYFHAPNPPAPPDSHRSYSSTDDNRLSGNEPEDYAQDLRVSAAAAAAAAAKTLDFSQFVLPRNLRRSMDESIDEEKYTPLNMRKLSTNSANTTSAGQMLMNSILSNENISESDNTTVSGGGGVGPGSSRLKGSSQDPSNSAAAAAAAAFYAESLNKDDCDFIGANVSLKLRSMDRTQRIIAEKLISEVLFYGQFNELERNARILPK